MNTTWSAVNWQDNNNYRKRLISLIISLLIVITMLFIPVKFDFSVSNRDTYLTVKLTKIKPIPQDTATKKERVEKSEQVSTVIKALKPLKRIKPLEKINKVKKQAIIATKTIQKTHSKAVTKPPNLGMILNSMESKTYLQKLDIDFQAKTDSFSFRQNKIPQNKPFVVINPLMPKLKLIDHLPLSKGILGFFMAIKDKKKTQDTLPYCTALGRHSHLCPNSNPLEY